MKPTRKERQERYKKRQRTCKGEAKSAQHAWFASFPTRKERKAKRVARIRRARHEKLVRTCKSQAKLTHRAVIAVSAWFASFRAALPKPEPLESGRSQRSQAWRKHRKELGVGTYGETLVPVTSYPQVLRWRARKGDREAKRKLAAA